ncbi:WD repeat-containing protein 81-like [Clytia hemisphaerica]|uniref:BEACH domain-containing protein n=1 Tax=Clytia hemisphaerica TaxID=252671 RepID=A0A7M6DR23_9CNID
MGQEISREDAKEAVSSVLKLPIHDAQKSECKKHHRFQTVISSLWLNHIKEEKISKLCLELSQLSQRGSIVDIFQYGHKFEKESNLCKVNVNVLKKDVSFCIKNTELHGKVTNEQNPSIYDVFGMQYLHMQEQLCKYLSKYTTTMDKRKEKKHKIIGWTEVKEFLQNTFHIEVIDLTNTSKSTTEREFSRTYQSTTTNSFFAPIEAIIESKEFVFVFEEYSPYDLKDALYYSPAIIGKSHINLNFLLYQILNTLMCLQRQQVYINTLLAPENLTLYHGTLWVGISVFDGVSATQILDQEPDSQPLIKIYDGLNTNLDDKNIILTEKLSVYTSEWVNCRISNFDYLMILNKLAGKKFGQALSHPVFPWVTDFSCNHGGYRDLKKTKFRLNKGDSQLDATFSTGVGNSAYGFGMMLNPIQHHVSDVLSDITYFMYHARKTSKDILCRHVRSRWVPDEYPANVRRMYQWTPDECIPEFFYDPSIFKSIHDDLADLGLPEWINSPEEFVKYHYTMLESPKVSSSLHHWIDLVFGYKLEGRAAKHAKNVHLALVDEHKDLKNYGIVQLFNKHHPKRKSFTEDLITPVDVVDGPEVRPAREFSMSWEYVDLGKSKDDSSLSSIGVAGGGGGGKDNEDGSKLPADSPIASVVQQQQRKQTKSFVDVPSSVASVLLDDDSIDPAKIHQVKNNETLVFSDIMEQTERLLRYEMMNNPPNAHGIGRYGIGTFSDTKIEMEVEYSHLTDMMKLYLCLVIEIVCFKAFRTRTCVAPLEERFVQDLKILKISDSAPTWVKGAIDFAIDPRIFKENTTFTKDELPNRDELCLQALMNTMNQCFNFPTTFDKIFKFLSSLFSLLDPSVNLQDNDTTTSNTYQQSLDIEMEKCARQLRTLLEHLDHETVHLLLMYLEPLFNDNKYQLLMYIHIFPPLSVALGPNMSRTVFLKGLQRVLDNASKSPGISNLLHQSYLSNILQAFGQDYFLEYIMGLLLEILQSSDHNFQINPHEQPTLTKMSTSSAQTSVIGTSLPNGSILSYEVTPYEAGKDSISLSSFNLDFMFSDQQNNAFQLLSTDSHESESDSVNSAEFESDGFPKPGFGRGALVKTEAQKTHTVLSYQEILSNSGCEEMIEVSSTSHSLPSFSYERERPFPALDQEYGRKDEKADAPFTVLLQDNDLDDHIRGTDIGNVDNEDLEVLLMDMGTSVRSETMVTEDGAQNVDLHRTVVDSLKWFIPWLGPNLTTENIAKPLLRNMSKIFMEITDPEDSGDNDVIDRLLCKVSPHIECLVEVASIYGDNIVMSFYLPHIAKLIENATNAASVSISLGSSLVSNLQLLMECCEKLQSEAIATHMEEFSVDFFQPLIRLLSTVKPFSTGVITKQFLSRKVVDIIGMFCQKLRREYAQEVMAPLLQQFFSRFDGIYALKTDTGGTSFITRKYTLLCKSLNEEDVNIRKPSPSMTHSTDQSESKNRISKTLTIEEVLEDDQLGSNQDCADKFADVYDTFSPSLAYHAYVLFCRVLGTHYLESTLYNSDLVWQLFTNHDKGLTHRMEDENEGSKSMTGQSGKWMEPLRPKSLDESQLAQRVSSQHIDGTWLRNWQRTFDGPSRSLEFLNLKLQTYAGHSSAIRDIYVVDNEHYFLSASRDKTVKLWLLKNHGNGTAHLGCSGTYDRHTRAVFAVQGLEAKRVVASCDGEINIWDPITNDTLNEFSASRGHSVTCIRTLPAPSPCIAAATSEGCLRIYDIRQKKGNALEWKVSPQTMTGVIRSMCVDTSGTWIAAGFSAGIFSAIDIRAGILRGQARIHDGEISQMEAISGTSFVSCADSIIRVWNDESGPSLAYKSSNEAFNSLLYTKQQLVWASSNKLTIHNPDKITQYHSYKLPPDILKGSLSKLAILPMNQLYLFGIDTGNLVLVS